MLFKCTLCSRREYCITLWKYHKFKISNRRTLLNSYVEDTTDLTFSTLRNITQIRISTVRGLYRVKERAFADLPNLHTIDIRNQVWLVIIDSGAFQNLPKLEHLNIVNTGISTFPDLHLIRSTSWRFFLELMDNPKLLVIPPNAFTGLCDHTLNLKITSNGLQEIMARAFNGSKLKELLLTNNHQLCKFHQEAFSGALQMPLNIDISHTALTALPEQGLSALKNLKVFETFTLKVLPPFPALGSLEVANLTYSSHCCSFRNAKSKSREYDGLCNISDATSKNVDQVTKDNLTQSQKDYEDVFYTAFKVRCQGKSTHVECVPVPNAFNPCEDIVGYPALRLAIWLVSVLAVASNFTVLMGLVFSGHKLTVPRFLICHLSFADMCMGIYLLCIATVDLKTRGQFHKYAIEWQSNTGCGFTGFLSIFSTELSIFTLTVITLERRQAIVQAMHPDRKLRLKPVAYLMASLWCLALGLGILPLLGVSSYNKVSFCLPMDIGNLSALCYIIFLLIINDVAVLIICCSYIHIYMIVRNPNFTSGLQDIRIAKRMALLIFTDFVCIVPISIVALLAATHKTIITVSQSKILLVFLYPFNALANPLLYSLCSRTFRRDLVRVHRHLKFWRLCGDGYIAASSSTRDGRPRRGSTSCNHRFELNHRHENDSVEH
uniref:lutropin-choriogonadotropic hormone receptor-like n=1 Tax=Myxine glutinosa TaxID=7769 RepID=UPI00358E9187